MKRYYLCDIHGDGDDAPRPWTATTGPFRPAAYAPGLSMAFSEIVLDDRGRPVISKCVVLVDAKDHSVLDGIEGVERLPDEPFDRSVTAMTEDSKTRLADATKVEQLAGESYRDVLRKVVPHFDDRAFGVNTD